MSVLSGRRLQADGVHSNDADQALMLLQAAQEKKSKELAQLAKQPAFKPLHGRADFQVLLASLKPTTK